MILNIAICDDDSVHVDLIKSYIEFMDISYDINYTLAYSGEELLEKLNGKLMDIVFLDIEMNGLNGIEVGRKIREKNKDAIIVYLTGYRDYAVEAFEIESFHYLIKPIIEEKFVRVMERVLLRLKEKKDFRERIRIFTIQTKDKLIQLKYEEIYYFEKYFRKINVHTLNESIEFYGAMKDLLGEIDHSHFIRCHQSYIVNKSKIRKIGEKTIILNGKEEVFIPVSRRYKEAVRDEFCKKMFNY